MDLGAVCLYLLLLRYTCIYFQKYNGVRLWNSSCYNCDDVDDALHSFMLYLLATGPGSLDVVIPDMYT